MNSCYKCTEEKSQLELLEEKTSKTGYGTGVKLKYSTAGIWT